MQKSNKVTVAAFSIASNGFLVIIKIIAGMLSGSVSIISEAIHSGMDLAASFIAFVSVKLSSKPADKEHPYGHGKIENVSGVIEGILIFIAAGLIIEESIKKILNPGEISYTSVAIIVMIISGVVNAIIAKAIYVTVKKEESIALEADALHHKTDVYASLGVAVGLLLIQLTGITILDPIVAIFVALMIIKEAWELTSDAFAPLLDTKLSDEEENKIKAVLDKYKNDVVNYNNLVGYSEIKTRKAGSLKHIHIHLLLNGKSTVKESNELSQKIEKDLEEVLSNTDVHIYYQPAASVNESVFSMLDS